MYILPELEINKEEVIQEEGDSIKSDNEPKMNS